MSDPIEFPTAEDSHKHALKILNALFQYDDFMLSVGNVIDVGCGAGLDMEWWASRTTRDEELPVPLNIKCTGVDLYPTFKRVNKYEIQEEIKYLKHDIEDATLKSHLKKLKLDTVYDIVWCHDVFQYAINPFQTLENFYDILSPGGMLVLSVPQQTNIVYHKQEYNQVDGVYYNHTLVSLIHMLAVSRFDCKAGFFKKTPDDPWLNVIVYKDDRDLEKMDPRTTRWYDLLDLKLLPDSADKSVFKTGHLRQKDLMLPWLNKSLIDYSQQ